jgi:hypothetical protein
VLSLDKMQWTRPLPWDRKDHLLAAGLYWEWIVREGRRLGATLGPNKYMEVRYEKLVEETQQSLNPLGEFIGHDLDFGRICQTSVGSVRTPLTSFKEELLEGRFAPVGRWKNRFTEDQLLRFERLVGKYLEELGYPLSHPRNGGERALAARAMRFEYRKYYTFKQWVKVNTPLSRWMVDYSAILIDK